MSPTVLGVESGEHMHQLALSNALMIQNWEAGDGPQKGPRNMRQWMEVTAPDNHIDKPHDNERENCIWQNATEER